LHCHMGTNRDSTNQPQPCAVNGGRSVCTAATRAFREARNITREDNVAGVATRIAGRVAPFDSTKSVSPGGTQTRSLSGRTRGDCGLRHRVGGATAATAPTFGLNDCRRGNRPRPAHGPSPRPTTEDPAPRATRGGRRPPGAPAPPAPRGHARGQPTSPRSSPSRRRDPRRWAGKLTFDATPTRRGQARRAPNHGVGRPAFRNGPGGSQWALGQRAYLVVTPFVGVGVKNVASM